MTTPSGLCETPTSPGVVLRELYLVPVGLSGAALARHLFVPRSRISRILRDEAAITADLALRLARFFSTTPEYWMNLQRAWDLARAKETIDVSGIKPLEAA
jgi:addiction module HigA family antidote